MIKYNNTVINSIIFKKSITKPDPEYIKKINILKEEIKNIKFENNFDKNNFKSGERNNESKNLNLKSFENLRNYKSKINNEKSLFTTIRNLLNKITEKTYEKLVVDLIDNIQLIYDNNDPEKDNITLFIFNFFTKNYFMSKIYSNIYNILCNKYSDFKNILINNLAYFDDILYNILNKNYTEINIDNYKSYFLFYSNCYNVDLIDTKSIIKMLLSFQLKMITLINSENKKEECDIINELIFIFVKNSSNVFKDKINISIFLHDKSECNCSENDNILFKNIYKLSNYKTYDYKSLTNKTIFKNKDVVDLFLSK